MKKKKTYYFSYRLALEKLKQKSQVLVILGRLLHFLVLLTDYFLR